jgi:insulysin
MPKTENLLKTKPWSYFTHLFGHEGRNSILSYLKKENLAQELEAGFETELNTFSYLYVDISLTQEGLNNY